jgi:hypothetical protein
MKISFYTVTSNLGKDNGYGYARHGMQRSLKSLGHEMTFNDKSARIQLSFCQPDLYSFHKGQYKIGYTPWESSSLPEGWKEAFESVDELWTTSEKCKEWYEEEGIKKDIRVYHHGVEDVWTPKLRKPGEKLKFLHIGEPSPRKGGQIVLDAFRAAFGSDTDVHLTIKAQGHSTVRAFASHVNRGGARSILGPVQEVYQNVTLMTENLSVDELVRLYHDHDVFVYPSWGEGFGLMPLQALATGMPTICTKEWAPYADKLGELGLDSKPAQSLWPHMHPGRMSEPSVAHLIELMRHTKRDFEGISGAFFDRAPLVHDEYNWDKLTEKAFKHLGE